MPVTGYTRPELLSPAGDWDSLSAAVRNGTDAVYLGVRGFNARVYAPNFSLEELGKAVDFCHSRGVRVYLAMNTLVKDRELSRFFTTLSRAYSLGIDAVIVQHVSFVDLIKSSFPGLKVFLSTQAAVGNLSSASLVKTADRIILPRELSLDDLRRFTAAGVPVEVFVHGALCFSYSGLCLFSSFVSNRSGNRGSCAQLCRKKYNGSHCLSTRELCLVRRVPELIQAGVHGLKIEGRMRSPLYVGVATRLYRKAIDSFLAGKFAVPRKEMAEMEVVFNREFTEGFFSGARDLISPEKPMNRGAFLGVMDRGEVVVKRPVPVGAGVGIWGDSGISGAVIRRMTVNGRKVSSAAAGERVDLGLEAADGTRIYLTSSPQISLAPDFTVSRPPFAKVRRDRVRPVLPETAPRESGEVKLLVKAYSLDEAREAARAGADLTFYNIFAPDFPGKQDWQEGSFPGAYLPRIMDDSELSQALALLREKEPSAVLTGNSGFLAHRAEFRMPVYLDYCLNPFNDLDTAYLRSYGATPVLSPELSIDEISELRDKDVVVLCHGDVVVVNTRVALADRELVDEKGFAFPVRQEGSYWQILNSRPLGLFNDIRKLREMGFGQFLIDKEGQGGHLASLYRKMLEREVPDRRLRRGHTSGHLYRPVG